MTDLPAAVQRGHLLYIFWPWPVTSATAAKSLDAKPTRETDTLVECSTGATRGCEMRIDDVAEFGFGADQ